MKYLLALFVLASSAAWAAAPVNDILFKGIVTTEGTVTGTNTGATSEDGEPTHANVPGGKSVWWFWTPTESGTATIDTVGSSFDTVLAVYKGTNVALLDPVAYSDDATTSVLTSKVKFSVKANTTYRIAVDGYNGTTGSITLNISLGGGADKSENDNYVDRIEIGGEYTVGQGSSKLATTEADENTRFYDPDDDGFFNTFFSFSSNSIWWTWTAPRSGSVTITNDMVINPAFNGDYLYAVVEVFTTDAATIDDLEPLPLGKLGSAFAERSSASVTLDVSAGEVLQIKTSSWDAEFGGKITLTVAMDTEVGNITNDRFIKKPILASTTTSVSGSNDGATADTGEPAHAGFTATRSVWWTWVAPTDGYLSLDTLGSVNETDDALDTVLAVYTGSQIDSLTLIDSNDNDGSAITSKVRFAVSKGVVYQIAVDSRVEGGSIQLNLNFIKSAIVITDDVDNVFANVNAANATFSVVNTGAPAVYDWQRKAAGTAIWVHYDNGSTDSPALEGDATTSTLTIAGPVPAAMNGDQFRCVITNSAGQVISKVGKFTVVSLNTFVGAPVSLDISVTPGPGEVVTYGASGLPSGLSLNTTTGVISGRINAKLGTYTISYWSISTVGSVKTKSAIQTYTISVQAFPSTMTGGYEGLLLNTGIPVGKVALSVRNTGAFSGKLTYNGVVSSLKGMLVLDSATAPTMGSATLTLKGGYTLVVSVLSDSTMTGTLSNGGLLADMSGDGVLMGSYSKVSPVPSASFYTMALVNPSSGPEGSGYASAQIFSTGLLKLKGRLADGTLLTGSALVDASTDGEFRFFILPYKGSAGYLAGWLPLTPRGLDRYHVPASGGGVFSWVKPANATDKAYPGGFGPVVLTALMEPWIDPGKSSYLLGVLGLVTPANPQTVGNFTLLLNQTGGVSNQGGNVEALPTLMNMNAASKVSVQVADANPTNPRGLTLSVNTGTGVFTGSFILTDGRKITTQGVLLQQTSGTAPNDFGRGFFQVAPLNGVPGTTVSGEVKFTGPDIP